MKIGVFDSGIGGEAVARDLRLHFPDAEIVTASDHEHVPYGLRSVDEIITLTDNAIQPLLSSSCDVIVIACNTATTLALPHLRVQYPTQLFIGIEPMIKTAAKQTRTHRIIVCATLATLRSQRYHELKESYASSCIVGEPDCSDWASMIESNTVNEQSIRNRLEPFLADKADVIVLGCTHYHWIKSLIKTIADNKATVLEPTASIAKQIQTTVLLRPQQTDRRDRHNS